MYTNFLNSILRALELKVEQNLHSFYIKFAKKFNSVVVLVFRIHLYF